MPELPSGTVTFLFTDIEGSTPLLQQQGERCSPDCGERLLVTHPTGNRASRGGGR